MRYNDCELKPISTMHHDSQPCDLNPERMGCRVKPARAWGVALWLVAQAGLPGAEIKVVEPFESKSSVAGTALDALVEERLIRVGIEIGPTCSDVVFLRRVYLDLTGTMPGADEVKAFLADHHPDKRAAAIDRLLESPAHADYMAMRWGDVLRIKAEFPINLWPNAVQAYYRWLRDALAANMPHDKFARVLLTSSGSNFRTPQVNFQRAVQGRTPASLAAATALTFMGTRIERWPADRRAGMEKFFSRLSFKATAEWKEEIVCLDPAPADAMVAMLPDGRSGRVEASRDPREVFVNWLVAPDNPWFARATVNRLWSWMMGRGIVHEPDDMRPDNPPSNPKLLDFLEKEFVASGYDRRKLFRLILNSRTYQRSSIPRTPGGEAEALFAFYPVRRLEAEVLVDSLCQITGTSESYSSPIPEPFTFLPDTQTAVSLGDGSIISSFLELFGRPSRDTGLEAERNNLSSDSQRLHMLNSSHVLMKIRNGPRLRKLWGKSQGAGKPEPVITALYLAILSRPPTSAEISTVQSYMRPPVSSSSLPSSSGGSNARVTFEDLAWALINSKEFLYRH